VILLSGGRRDRYEVPENHGAERDATHEPVLIPIFKSAEHRSAGAMEAKGWGYISSKCPHNHYFFRPVKGLRDEARAQVQALPTYHHLHRLV